MKVCIEGEITDKSELIFDSERQSFEVVLIPQLRLFLC